MKIGPKVYASISLACVLAARSQARAAVTVGDAINATAGRLVINQTGTGNWPGENDFTGAIIAGMGNASLASGTANYRNSTLSGANFILGNAAGNFLGDEAYGLTLASQLSVNPLSNTYRSAINTFYKTTVPNTSGGTAGFINNLVAAYTQNYGEQSQAAFYIAEHTVAAAYVNAPDLSVWRSGLINVLAQVDDNDFFPIQASGVALWALAKTGPLDNTLISSNGFWAGKTLADLPGIIAARQITSGSSAGGFYASFGTDTGGFTEDAVYATLGLSVANPLAYQSQVLSAKNWLANSVIPSGANQGMLADNPSNPSAVLNAYTGEGAQAMAAAFPVFWNGSIGNWSDPTQWNVNPTIPDNNFTSGLFFDVTINNGVATLDSSRAIGFLTLNGGTLTGPGNLQLSGGQINGTFAVAGTTTILAGTLVFAGTSQSAGQITGGGNLLVNSGSTLTSNGITIPNIILNGTIQVRPNGTSTGTSKVNSLIIAHSGSGTSSIYTGSLNLADNALIVQSTDPTDKSTKITSLNEAITIGANGGLWNGSGIASSTAAADTAHLAVGVFDNAVLGLSTIGGLAADSNSILVAVSHLGDTNRNGIIDIQDQSIVTNNWQQSRAAWSSGDLNHDGFVDIQDLTIVTNNWQVTSVFALSAGALPAGSGAVAAVPEPASLALLAIAAAIVLPRRRPGKNP